jgi:hypothetical protein
MLMTSLSIGGRPLLDWAMPMGRLLVDRRYARVMSIGGTHLFCAFLGHRSQSFLDEPYITSWKDYFPGYHELN